ncbi:MAG: hypothetical protein HKN17_07435 [Rhodothermales bacterium]|nr:hypothetical protein [Rhodothermales bacterium]
MATHISRLFEHLWWADERCWHALSAMDDPPNDLVGLYAHIIGAELVWIDRIEGVPQSADVWPEVDLSGALELADTARERYLDFIERLEPGTLQENVAYINSAGKQFESSVEDILLHVALHGAYHRGQVALGVRTYGAAPEPTDYIAFIRGAPAATRADASDDRPDIPLL